MLVKPRLLDLFCGAGGAAMGYHRAGFEVVGVDIEPQPRYPFAFYRDDALRFVREHWCDFDVLHASPPCQVYSAMSACRPGLAEKYPDLVAPTRAALVDTGLPYVIENVVGAPLVNPLLLCGSMFDLDLHRHRMFESSVSLPLMLHGGHDRPTSRAGHWRPGTIISVSGNCSPIAVAKAAMGIDWMTRAELAESIPPAYTEVDRRATAGSTQGRGMTVDLATIKAGTVVWTKGREPYGDEAIGACFIRREHDRQTGESVAVLLTYQAGTPRQGSLHLLDRRGGNRDLGLIARLIRVPMSEVRPPTTEGRDWRKVLLYANKAGQAAFVPPNNGIDSTTHGALLDAARLLHREAIELYRGPA